MNRKRFTYPVLGFGFEKFLEKMKLFFFFFVEGKCGTLSKVTCRWMRENCGRPSSTYRIWSGRYRRISAGIIFVKHIVNLVV